MYVWPVVGKIGIDQITTLYKKEQKDQWAARTGAGKAALTKRYLSWDLKDEQRQFSEGEGQVRRRVKGNLQAEEGTVCVRTPGTGSKNEQLRGDQRWTEKPARLHLERQARQPRASSTGTTGRNWALGGYLPREAEGWEPQRRDRATEGRRKLGLLSEDKLSTNVSGLPLSPVASMQGQRRPTAAGTPGALLLCCGGPNCGTASHPLHTRWWEWDGLKSWESLSGASRP